MSSPSPGKRRMDTDVVKLDGERFLPDATFNESCFIEGSWWKRMLCYTLHSAEGK